MALQDEILKALASGFGMGGIPLYNQETPTNMMTGQPFFRPNAPTSGDIGVKPNLSKQISPALAVSQAISGPVGNINNQPQFNSRDAMNSYNYTPASRNQGEGIQDYVNRLISAPTGAGQLSEQFMNSWAQANKALPKNNEEPVADKVVPSGGSNPPPAPKEEVSFGNFSTNIGKNRELGSSVSIPTSVNTDISYWGIPQGSEMDEYAALAASGAAKRAAQEEAQRIKEEAQRKQALQYLAGLGY